MFGYARTSGLPLIDVSERQMDSHIVARKQHEAYAIRMKLQFDQQMKANECQIRVGDKVLCKQAIMSKSDSCWDPNPFVVVSIKGSMIKASRTYPKQMSLVRNSSFFKLYWGWSEREGRGSKSEEVQHDSVQMDVEASVASGENRPPDQDPAWVAVLPGTSGSGERKAARSVGRPTKEQAVEIEKERAAKQTARLAANPPTRYSKRLAQHKSRNQIRHLEGGRYCNAI
jgi:hypothetical protein